jgi:hypothetical protein
MNRIKKFVQSESSIQTSILKYLRGTYPSAVTIKIHEDPVFGTPGLPDILFIWDGDVFFFEVKRPGETTSPIQNVVMKKLRLNRTQAYTVTSVEEVKKIVEGNLF